MFSFQIFDQIRRRCVLGLSCTNNKLILVGVYGVGHEATENARPGKCRTRKMTDKIASPAIWSAIFRSCKFSVPSVICNHANVCQLGVGQVGRCRCRSDESQSAATKPTEHCCVNMHIGYRLPRDKSFPTED